MRVPSSERIPLLNRSKPQLYAFARQGWSSRGGGWIHYAQFHGHNRRDLLQHKVWWPMRQRMPGSSTQCWNIQLLSAAQQSFRPQCLSVHCLSHTNGKSTARHPIHLTHQHWFLHTRNISHTLHIFRFTHWLAREQCSQQDLQQQTFSCGRRELDWGGGGLSKLLRTMLDLAGLLPSSLPLYNNL